jgi:HSP20 family protein
MALLRWESPSGVSHTFQEAERLRNEMNRIWELVSGTQSRFKTEGIPPQDSVREEDEYLFIKVDLSGIEAKHLDLSVIDNQLILQGGRRTAEEDKKILYPRSERDKAFFRRVINLPFWVDPEGAEARVKDGILIIKLARAGDAKPRSVRVQTGH